MAFKPGQSGNPNGTKREKKFLAALERAIAQDQEQRLRDAAEKLLDFAAAGEPWAINMLADRLDGRPKQQIEATDEQGRTLAIALVSYDPAQLQAPALPAPDTSGSGLRH